MQILVHTPIENCPDRGIVFYCLTETCKEKSIGKTAKVESAALLKVIDEMGIKRHSKADV